MSSAKKVVLVSKSDYSPSHDGLLRELIGRKIALFSVVGRDCERWESAMDELIVGPDGANKCDITTTSHPHESVGEVVEAAEEWATHGSDEVEIIEV